VHVGTGKDKKHKHGCHHCPTGCDDDKHDM
jgi:hypothetical protein